MATWSKDDLSKIAEADDLRIAPFRDDGATFGTPTWIWSVTVDGALYVRAYNGRDSRGGVPWEPVTSAGISAARLSSQ